MSGTTRWWYPVILVLQVISGNSIPSPSVCYTNYIVDPVPVHVTPITLWTQSQCVLHRLHHGPSPSACYTDYIVDPVPVCVTLITLWTQSKCVKLITLWNRSSACYADYFVDPVQYVLHRFHCGPSTCLLVTCHVHLGTATFYLLNNVHICTDRSHSIPVIMYTSVLTGHILSPEYWTLMY